jgi:hypothetical protein
MNSIAPSVPSAAKAPRSLSRSDSTHSTSSTTSIDIENNNTVEMITDSKQSGNTTKTVQMRNIVLEMLHDILCDKANGPDYISKFSSTITNKWPLLFFAPNLNPYTVVLAARIFARICITEGPAYVQKFRSTSDGFVVLRSLLPHYWNLTQLQETLILMVVGIDIADYPIYSAFDINHLRTCLNMSKDGSKAAVPDIMPIIIAMWDEGRKATEVANSKLSHTPTLLPLRTRSNSLSLRPVKHKELTAASRAQISQNLNDFIQLFDELYNSRPLFKEACNKQDVVDYIVQVLFPSVCHTHHMTADDELNSKDVVLTNFDLEHLSSPSSAMSSPIDGSPYFDRFGRVIDDDTASIDSNNTTSGNSIIKRGGTSALMTKTSPHVSKRANGFMTRLR